MSQSQSVYLFDFLRDQFIPVPGRIGIGRTVRIYQVGRGVFLAHQGEPGDDVRLNGRPVPGGVSHPLLEGTLIEVGGLALYLTWNKELPPVRLLHWAQERTRTLVARAREAAAESTAADRTRPDGVRAMVPPSPPRPPRPAHQRVLLQRRIERAVA